MQSAKIWLGLFLLVFLALPCFSCDVNKSASSSEEETRNVVSMTSPIGKWIDFTENPPDRDLKNLAIQYGLTPNRKSSLNRFSEQGHSVGRLDMFTVINLRVPELYEVEAELVYVTDSAYWYVDIEKDFDRNSYEMAAIKWEQIVLNHFAGHPAIKLTILNTSLQGVSGYFSDVDSYPHWVHINSNDRPMIYLDPLRNKPGSDAYMSVLIHEFHHLIHNMLDEGEEAWVNEGLAELDVRNLGYETHVEKYFLNEPNTQLNFWPSEPKKSLPHYGAASLFFEFVSGRISDPQSLNALMEESQDGLSGVDSWLRNNGTDFHDEFGKWTVANYLGLERGEYSYPSRAIKLKSGIDRLEIGENNYLVSQYGTRYFKMKEIEKDIGIKIKGNSRVGRFNTKCHTKCWWSNKGDSIDSSLTLDIDLTTRENPELRFELWHDIEEGWDYGYLSVSTDQGETWETLAAKGTTSKNPVGSNYGYGYTGESDWVTNHVGLSDFIGKEILVKFQYVTDAAVHLDGMLIKGIRLIDMNVEIADEYLKYNSSGFVLVDDFVKQNFLFQVLKKLPSGKYVVDNISLDEFNEALYLVDKEENLKEVTVVVSGMTGLTQQPAKFTLSVSEGLDN